MSNLGETGMCNNNIESSIQDLNLNEKILKYCKSKPNAGFEQQQCTE